MFHVPSILAISRKVFKISLICVIRMMTNILLSVESYFATCLELHGGYSGSLNLCHLFHPKL